MTINSSSNSRSIWAWQLVAVIMGISIINYVSNFIFSGFSEESIRQNIRVSARISVVLFCITLGSNAIHLWMKNSLSWWLMMNRKFFGITFALNHFIHLFFLFILQYEFHPVFDLANKGSLLAGGIAYFFIGLMFLTSFSYFKNKLSFYIPNIKRLNTFGSYWIWIVFLSSNGKRVLSGELGYTPVVILLLSILLIRLWKLTQN